jgi:mucin-19
VLVNADTLKMLNGSRITASLGTVQINTVNDALVTGIMSGSGGINAISIKAGGHLLAGTDPARPFDLSAMAPGAGIQLLAGLGIGDETEADNFAVDQKGSPAGSANLITAVVNPLILRTNAIDLMATKGDADLVTATKITSGSIVAGAGSINIVANQDFNVSNLSAMQGNVVVTAAGSIAVTNVSATSDPARSGGRVALTANNGSLLVGSSTSSGSDRFTATGDVTYTSITATGTTADPGNVTIVSLNGAIDGTTLMSAGSASLTGNDITFGSIFAGGRADLLSSGFIHGNTISSAGALTETAGADINVVYTRAATVQVQTPTSIIFGDMTVDNTAAFAAQVADIGTLHAAPGGNGPLFFTLTGYQGGQGLLANVYVDAPNGVVMPLLREGQADITTNALDYGIVNATIGQWLKFTTPDVVIWDDNRSPRPVRGFDVQLFQPSKSFFLYQNGFRTDTNAVVIQYDERAQVVEERNGEAVAGGSLVRDIDRLLGINNFGSVLLQDDSPNSSGPFFRGDAFESFLYLLRDRHVHGPSNAPAVSLKGLASGGSIGKGYQIVVRGGP